MASTRITVALLSVLLSASLLATASAADPSSSPSASPAPTTAAEPSPTPMPTPGLGGTTPGVLDWQPVGPPFIRQNRSMRELVAWRGGFALLATRISRRADDRAPSVWRSMDGRAWNRAPAPAAMRNAIRLLPFRGGLIVVTDDKTDYRHRGIEWGFWRSADTVTWERIGSLSYRLPERLERRGCQANHQDIASIDGALMVYVTLCWDPCCGSVGSPIAMLTGTDARDRRDGGVIAWRSTDGATWERQPLQGLDRADGEDYGIDLREAPGVLLILRQEGGTYTLLRSRDGVRWAPFGSIPEGFWNYGSVEFAPVGDHVLLLGETQDSEITYGNELIAWVLDADGTTTQSLRHSPSVATDMIVDGSNVLVIGRSQGRGPNDIISDDDDEEWAWIMGSQDSGRTWDEDLMWVGADGSCFQQVARSAVAVVTIACVGSGSPRDRPEPRTPQFFVAPIPGATSTDWGPLAVVDDPGIGGHDAGLGPGRLVITDRCVYLQGRNPAAKETLVWRSGQVRWDRTRRQILYNDRDLGVVRLRTGDRMTLGGYGLGSPASPDNQEIPIGPWVQPPDASCPTDRWVAEQVRPIGR